MGIKKSTRLQDPHHKGSPGIKSSINPEVSISLLSSVAKFSAVWEGLPQAPCWRVWAGRAPGYLVQPLFSVVEMDGKSGSKGGCFTWGCVIS